MPITLPQSIMEDIRNGRVILVLGAGCSATSLNRSRKEIATATTLAEKLAHGADLAYANDSLRDVFEATAGILGEAKIQRIFEAEFSNCTPSEELTGLFSFPWRRVYSFNIDDAVNSIPKVKRTQELKFYNALKDRRDEWSGYGHCQVIYLHGHVNDFSSGFIFSESEYARTANKRHPWYEKLGEDFYDWPVIFVGTTLDEPLFLHHINAMGQDYRTAGRSHLITPSYFSDIRERALQSKNIVHIRATLAEFTQALRKAFPEGLTTHDLDINLGTAASKIRPDSSRFTKKDIEALRGIFQITRGELTQRFRNARHYMRRFYEGFGPTWRVILEKGYAPLSQYEAIYTRFSEPSDNRFFIITGESGSGKSTCGMYLALRYAEEHHKMSVFEYTEGSTTLKETISSLSKYLDGSPAILLLDELHIYASDLEEAFSDRSFTNIRILSSARSGEWNSRIVTQLPDDVTTVELPRFEDRDIDTIIDKTLQHLPAPAFTKLSRPEQRQRFEKSRKQLLIALREATQSAAFDDIIEDEFSRISDADTRLLFLTVALSTVARSGISRSAARTIFESARGGAKFADLLQKDLEGIVDESRLDRLQTRHEYYAKLIIEKKANFIELTEALKSILEYFCQFQMPVIKHVSKLDAQLFKFILNNKFVYDLFNNEGSANSAADFYQEFESKLQLDGHYWLQYGLLLRRIGNQEEAYKTLIKSIQAFPENDYAQHALAQQKLIAAGGRDTLDVACRKLIDEAVDFLLKAHFRLSSARHEKSVDEYPIVTLGYYHVDALCRLNRVEDAKKVAKDYFEKIQEISRRSSNHFLDDLKARLLLLNTTGQWKPLRYRQGQISYL